MNILGWLFLVFAIVLLLSWWTDYNYQRGKADGYAFGKSDGYREADNWWCAADEEATFERFKMERSKYL